MLQSKGFEVYDLGTDVTPEKFTEAVKKYQPDLLCIYALLTTTMPVMKKVIERMEVEDLREDLIIMIGGAPITDNFRNIIHADLYAANAADAADKAEKILKSKRK